LKIKNKNPVRLGAVVQLMEHMIKLIISMIKFSLKKALQQILGVKNYTRLIFRLVHGYPLNLDNPRSLSEKIQWIKLNCKLELLAPFVDKYEVREFVKKRAGEKYLVPLIGIYDHFDQIDLDSLPIAFAMKATHGCGWNILVNDKHQVDWNKARAQIKKWLKSNYYDAHLEPIYKNIKGRIIIEELIRDSSGELKNFKFYCCNGAPMGAHVNINCIVNHECRVYDTGWKEFIKKNCPKELPPIIPKPVKLEELLDICCKLSKGFPFVRVDLYYTDERIYFSELTFTPANGLEPFDPVSIDFYFGEAFAIKDYANYINRLQP
jgi:hypothetical protein